MSSLQEINVLFKNRDRAETAEQIISGIEQKDCTIILGPRIFGGKRL